MPDIFDTLLNKTCTVQEYGSAAQDAYGQKAESYSAVASNVPCRISSLSKRERGQESKSLKFAAVLQQRLFIRPLNFAVTERHRILLDGITYNVIAVLNPSGLDHHLELTLEKVTP